MRAKSLSARRMHGEDRWIWFHCALHPNAPLLHLVYCMCLSQEAGALETELRTKKKDKKRINYCKPQCEMWKLKFLLSPLCRGCGTEAEEKHECQQRLQCPFREKWRLLSVHICFSYWCVLIKKYYLSDLWDIRAKEKVKWMNMHH